MRNVRLRERSSYSNGCEALIGGLSVQWGLYREILARIKQRNNGTLLPIVGLGTAEKTVPIGGCV